MTSLIISLLLIAFLIFLFQCFVAYRVARFVGWSTYQKVFFVLICVLVPLFPAIIFQIFMSADGKTPPERDIHFTEQGQND
jgi:beta-lactamase regulating signal transducer with metallopeptidase domain